MKARHSGNGNSNIRHTPRGPRILMQGKEAPQNPPAWKLGAALAAGGATFLLVLHGNLSQLGPLHLVDAIQLTVAAALAGMIVTAFTDFSIRLVEALSRSDLSEILEGGETISHRWCYIFLLGALIGAGIALFSHLAGIVLPLLSAHPILT